jgi:hypothetical protein
LRTRRESKGQIIILIVIVLIGMFLVFGLLSALSGRRGAAPLVKEASWLVDGRKVSTADQGEEVRARIVIEATEQYVGSIVVRIKKDVSMWFDSDFQLSTISVELVGSQQKTVELAFTPDEASGGGWGSLRGYFVEIEFQATRTTWEMENTYPPRLTVNT